MVVVQKFVDLHSHTTASDGTFAPAVNVRSAQSVGLSALAITDHDTVAGLKEAIAEGERIGIEVVPGVEISTFAGGQDIHVLGYYMDYEDSLLLQRLASLRDTRNDRNELIVNRLNELGIQLTMDEVVTAANKKPSGDGSIGRPHIADALIAKGAAASRQDAFDRYLATGAAAYVHPPRITPTDAVNWIREAGGCPVLAHPGLYRDDALVRELLAGGFAGIEVYHSEHSAEQEAVYAELALSYGLIATAGSDYHGERNGVIYHAPLGAKKLDIAVLDLLRQGCLGN